MQLFVVMVEFEPVSGLNHKLRLTVVHKNSAKARAWAFEHCETVFPERNVTKVDLWAAAADAEGIMHAETWV